MEKKLEVRIFSRINSWKWVKKIKDSQRYQRVAKDIKRNREIIYIILGIIGSTLAIGKMMDIQKPSFIGGDEDAWLGYWGSIVGIMGAYFVLKIQLKSDNKKHKAETVDNTFFNLLNLHNDILKENAKKVEEISTDLFKMHSKLEREQELLEIKQYIDKNTTTLQRRLNELSETLTIEIADNNPEESIFFKIKLSPIRTIDYSSILIKFLLEGRVTELDSYSTLIGNYVILKDIEISPEGKKFAEMFFLTEQELFEIDKQKSKCIQVITEKYPDNESMERYEENISNAYANFCKETDKMIKEIIEEIFSKEEALKNMVIPSNKIEHRIREVFEKHLVSFGYYFRLFHRIVKFLNENREQGYITEEQLNNYLGILRAMIDEKTMALIFYNATYLVKGKNMKVELQKNYFFGKKDDFDDEGMNIFLTKGTLLFDDDYEMLKELTKAFPPKENYRREELYAGCRSNKI